VILPSFFLSLQSSPKPKTGDYRDTRAGLEARSQGARFTCPNKVAMQRMHVNIFTHRLGCSYQSLAHDLTSKEPLGGRYPVMPSSVGRGKGGKT
jgi:hypothetical protein